MDPAQLALSYTAGALAFLSPCSLPMLPAYVSYYIERREEKGGVLSGLAFSASTTAGFLFVFLALGVLPSLVIGELVAWVHIATPLIGSAMILLGVLAGWTRVLERAPRLATDWAKGSASFLLYGAAYGVASLGCSLPVFLLVVLQGATAGDIGEMLLLFLAFGAGAATLIIPLTLSLALAKGAFRDWLQKAMPYVKRANGVVLILAGAYMIWAGLVR